MRLQDDDPRAFPTLVSILAAGGIAIAPGDTMYGLVGIAPDTEAKLRRVKGRGVDKPFLQLVPDESWLPALTAVEIPGRLARYWPGPLTVIFPSRQGGTVAVRVPASGFLVRLLRAVGRPLFSTSVNRAGAAPLAAVDEMCREFEDDVDVILDGGDIAPGPPSTLVDATARPFRILRQGSLLLAPEDLA